MSANPRRVVPFAKTVVRGIREENVTFMAASIAYQAFISLLPLLVLVFFLVSIVGDEQLAATVADTTEGFLPQSGRDLLEDAITGSVATAGTSAIGLVTLVWGSLKIFRGLDTAFSEIYDSTAENSFLEQLRDALVVFLAIGTALIAAAVASAAFAFFPDSALLGALNPLLLVIGLTVAFLPMYYFFPDVDVGVREVLPGVVVAAVGWAALQALFQVYVGFASGSASAGAIGAVLVLLTWLYFGGLVLLIGAVVNAANGGRLPAVADEVDGPRDVPPGEAERLRGELECLRRRLREVEREHALAENDLKAQRKRRCDLEDRTDSLEADVDRLRSENARLRRIVERRREPRWWRLLRGFAERVTRIEIHLFRTSRE